MIDLWARRAPIRFLSQLTIMTTLKSRLQLSLLNRKKGRNLLEKGFTLVELMIVIVIVGVLSGVALPNFLGTPIKPMHKLRLARWLASQNCVPPTWLMEMN